MKKILIGALCGLTVFIVIFYNAILASANELSLTEQKEKVIYFLNDNIYGLEKDYNDDVGSADDYLHINGYEGFSLVYILDDECYGVYADFNGENGYLIISLDYIIYDIKNKGDLKYLKSEELTYYSTVDGFVWFDGTMFQPYAEATQEDYGISLCGMKEDVAYFYPEEYMEQRYPSYSIVSSSIEGVDVDTMVFIARESLSYYVNYSKYGIKYENNDTLTALFLVMNQYQAMGNLPNLSTLDYLSNVTYTMTQTEEYKKYGKGPTFLTQNSYWQANESVYLERIPKLYNVIRLQAVNYSGYNPEKNLSLEECKTTYYWTARMYNYWLDVRSTNLFINVMYMMTSGNRSVFTMIKNSITLGNVSVVMFGFLRYEYYIKGDTAETKKVMYLYRIADGAQLYFIDPTLGAQFSFMYN